MSDSDTENYVYYGTALVEKWKAEQGSTAKLCKILP